jgi:hypothetical protein
MMNTILSYSNKTCMSAQPDCADLNKVATTLHLAEQHHCQGMLRFPQSLKKHWMRTRKLEDFSIFLLLWLILVVIWLYLTLIHVTLIFSLPLIHHDSSNRLQHLAHSHISISHINVLFTSQHHHSRLNHFRIYFMDNEFEKKII